MDAWTFCIGMACGAGTTVAIAGILFFSDEKKLQNERELRERMEAIAKRAVALSGGLTLEQLQPFVERTNAAIAKIDPPKRRKGDKK